MKYLSDYTNDKLTVLFKETGAFFAFSNEQFNEKKVDGEIYVSLGGGFITPKHSAQRVVDGINEIGVSARKQDLEENGKQAIIERELKNHESFYTGSIEDTEEALKEYGITREEILAEYRRLAPTISM